MGLSPPTPEHESPGVLLDQLLGSLLDDFSSCFERGLLLLDRCPETVMPQDQQLILRDHLVLARKELALEMETLAPWHQLVLSVWNLSAALRRHGVTLP